MLRTERPVQVHLHETGLGPAAVKLVHGLAHRAGNTSHGHHHIRGIRRAIVVEEFVVASGDGVDLSEILLHDAREGVVIRIAGLAVLEECVWVLDGAAHQRMLRIERAGAEGSERVAVQQRAQALGIDLLDSRDLMRGAESVKEMHERRPALERRQMRHGSEVHDLLDAAGAQHGESGIAAAHHVGMVAENAHGMRTDGTRGDVQHDRQSLARYTVQHRYHQHQSLAGCKARGKGAGLRRAVHGCDGTRLRLHLHHRHRLAENVLPALGGPKVRMLRHGRRRRDGIDGCYLGKLICNSGGGFIAVQRNCSLHFGNTDYLSSPYLATASSRILYLRILPAAFIGNPSTNSMYLGTLCLARRATI